MDCRLAQVAQVKKMNKIKFYFTRKPNAGVAAKAPREGNTEGKIQAEADEEMRNT